MDDNSRFNQAKELLFEYIKLKKLRNTPERSAVLKAVCTVGTPFTVDLLKEYLDEVFPMTRVTVYNNLELFFKVGIVIKRPIGGNVVEYEACIETQTHHHLICKICGQLFEFKDASIERFLAQKKYKKFKMTNCSVVVYGICNKCQSRIGREKRKQKQNTK